MGGLVERNIRTCDVAADLAGAAFQDAYSGPAHFEKAALFRRCMPDNRAQLSAVWHRPAHADLSPGIHGLHSMEGRAGHVPALGGRNHVDDVGRPDCTRWL